MKGGQYVGAPPKAFDLWRMFSPLVAAASRERGNPGGKHREGDTFEVGQLADDPSTVLSVGAPLGTKFSGAHRWRFTDGEHWSPNVRTVRFASVRIGGDVGVGPPLLPLEARARVEVTVPTGLTDPTIELAVLRPWSPSTDGMTIPDLVREEIADEEQLDDEFYDAVLKLIEPYLGKESPQGWEVWIEPDQLDVQPGGTANAMLRITTGEPASRAFAIRAVDVAEPGRDTYSDVFAFRHQEDGSNTFLYVE